MFSISVYVGEKISHWKYKWDLNNINEIWIIYKGLGPIHLPPIDFKLEANETCHGVRAGPHPDPLIWPGKWHDQSISADGP